MSATTEAVRERPILFSGSMVRAILDGCKTQTRRIAKLPPETTAVRWVDDRETLPSGRYTGWAVECGAPLLLPRQCPYGEPGDRLWARETWALVPATAYRCSTEADGSPVAHRESPDGTWWAVYRAGWTRSAPSWKPSIHMPRWACRLTLRVTNVRVERVQDISEADAQAEGLTKRGYWWDVGAHWTGDGLDMTASGAFRFRWDELNFKRGYGWDANPWVWVVSFEREGSI